MNELCDEANTLLAHISKIIEYLIQKDTSYNYYIDKDKATQNIFKYYYEKVPMETIKAMSDFELTGFVEADLMTLLLISEDDI